MWITKDKSGSLQLWENKPVRHNPPFLRKWWNWCNNSDFYWHADEGFFTILDKDRYPQYGLTLKWEDEPLEVAIVPTSFIKEVNNLTDAICGSELGRPENKEKGDVLVAMKKVNEQIKDIRWRIEK